MAVAREQTEQNVATVNPEDSVREAANLMERRNVGCLVVVNEYDEPLGMLTDRDIVVNVLDDVTNVDAIDVGDVMTRDPVTIREGSNIMDLFEVMSYHAVRRLPVVNESGAVVNIVSFDDLIRLLADELNGLADVLASESTRKNIRDFLSS